MRQNLTIILLLVSLAPVGCESQPADIGAPMSVAIRRRPWNTEQISGQEMQTAHYRIYTTTDNRALLNYIPGFMEAAHENYLYLTGLDAPQGEKLMPIYLMGTRKQWTTLTRSVVKQNTNKYLSIEAGGYCYRGVCVFWDMGGLATFSVASHEGLHQFFHRRLRNHLPMWLEEGLCATAEGYEFIGDDVVFTPKRNPARFGDLRTAIIQQYWIPLNKLLPMDASDAIGGYTERAVGYYGQLWALALFIRSTPTYRAGLARLIADAEAGKLNEAIGVPPEALKKLQLRGRIYNQTISEPVFRHYISDDLEGFERNYYAFAKQLASVR